MKNPTFNTENYSRYNSGLVNHFQASIQKVKDTSLSKTDVESLTIARKF